MFGIIQADFRTHDRLDAFAQTFAIEFDGGMQVGQVGDGQGRHFFTGCGFD